MRVLIHPGDEYGCGNIRLIWPARAAAAAGHNVEISDDRKMHLKVEGNTVVDVDVPEDCAVLVLQRPTHSYLAQAVPLIRSKGVAVVIDVDDDLNSVHRDNAAYLQLIPDRHRLELARVGWREPRLGQMVKRLEQIRPYLHSWQYLLFACERATLVTVSTSRLLARYAPRGNGVVLPNYLAEHYYQTEHADSDLIGWPASLHSHPNDPQTVGSAVARVIREQRARFVAFGDATGVGRAFGLSDDPESRGIIEIEDWPAAIAQLGIGIAPLADTTFNRSKSWLKPLELSAVGVPWIASPRVEYTRLHQLGAGVLADKPADWHKILTRMVKSPAWRQELTEQGRQVAAQLRLVDHADEYWDAWAHARVLEDAEPRIPQASTSP